MKNVECPRGWLKEQCDKIKADATLVTRLEQRIAELEVALAKEKKTVKSIKTDYQVALDRCWYLNGVESKIDDILEEEIPEWWDSEESSLPATNADGVTALANKYKQRIATLEAQLKDIAENEDPIGCIVRLQAELAERDAEIARMNKIWDDAVDYGARQREAKEEYGDALRDVLKAFKDLTDQVDIDRMQITLGSNFSHCYHFAVKTVLYHAEPLMSTQTEVVVKERLTTESQDGKSGVRDE